MLPDKKNAKAFFLLGRWLVYYPMTLTFSCATPRSSNAEGRGREREGAPVFPMTAARTQDGMTGRAEL